MSAATEILKAARQLIEKREDWWDGSGGLSAQPAGTVCVMQALAKASHEIKRADYPTAWEECYELLNALTPTLRRHGLATYNDTHSHEDVLALFDRAIAATEP